MENKSKITIHDLIGDIKVDNQGYTYKIANNQKEFSHNQKVKP
jgi:hypothetical protein